MELHAQKIKGAHASLETAFRFREGRRLRLILSSVRVTCWFWTFLFSNSAAVSPYRIFGSRQVLVLESPFGGGLVLSFRWCALGVGFGRYPN